MKNSKKVIKYAIILCISLIFIYIIMNNRHFLKKINFKFFNIKHFREYILSFGRYADFIFIILYSLKPILIFIPATLFWVVGGNVFGPFYAAIYSIIGSIFASTLAFYLARALGKPFVDKFLKGKALKLDNGIEEHGFKILLLMRLSTLFAFDPLSFAAGLTKMKYREFLLASIIGIIPEIIAFTRIGHKIGHSFSIRSLMPLLAVVIIATLASFLYKKGKKTNNIK